MKPIPDEFHLEEFKQLRDEVVQTMSKAEALLQYAVLISAAVFSWLVAASLGQQASGKLCAKLPPTDLPLSLLVWWIPTATVVVVGLLGGARYIRVKEAGAYLRQLERALGSPALGWEKFLADRFPTVALVSMLAWLVLLSSTTYVAIEMGASLRSLMPCQDQIEKK